MKTKEEESKMNFMKNYKVAPGALTGQTNKLTAVSFPPTMFLIGFKNHVRPL